MTIRPAHSPWPSDRGPGLAYLNVPEQRTAVLVSHNLNCSEALTDPCLVTARSSDRRRCLAVHDVTWRDQPVPRFGAQNLTDRGFDVARKPNATAKTRPVRSRRSDLPSGGNAASNQSSARRFVSSNAHREGSPRWSRPAVLTSAIERCNGWRARSCTALVVPSLEQMFFHSRVCH